MLTKFVLLYTVCTARSTKDKGGMLPPVSKAIGLSVKSSEQGKQRGNELHQRPPVKRQPRTIPPYLRRQ